MNRFFKSLFRWCTDAVLIPFWNTTWKNGGRREGHLCTEIECGLVRRTIYGNVLLLVLLLDKGGVLLMISIILAFVPLSDKTFQEALLRTTDQASEATISFTRLLILVQDGEDALNWLALGGLFR